jgi:hypothetical protein
MELADLGVDFSMARPKLAGSGAKYVVRYSAGAGMASNPATHPKLITPAEFNQLLAEGYDVIANSEWYESRVTEGARAGGTDGAADLALWRSCGLAKGATIYVSWDAHPDVDKWDEVDAYLVAYNKALLGYYKVGAYAGTPYLKHALAKGIIVAGWRPNAGSWSNDGLPYQPDTSTPEKRAALVALATKATPAHIWQTGNYWFNKSADENLIVRTPVGSHKEALNVAVPKPPAPKPAVNDLPTTGDMAVKFTNPKTGARRSAAGWLVQIVNLLLDISVDVKAIRAKLDA